MVTNSEADKQNTALANTHSDDTVVETERYEQDPTGIDTPGKTPDTMRRSE